MNKILEKHFNPKYREDICYPSHQLAYLLSDDRHSFSDIQIVVNMLCRDLPIILHAAFNDEDSSALLDIHQMLYNLYEIILDPSSLPTDLYEQSHCISNIRNEIETSWLNYELPRIQTQLPTKSESKNPELLSQWFIYRSQEESDLDKSLLKFLRNKASIEQFNLFVITDAPLNYRFSDVLALARLHSSQAMEASEIVKAEIDRNILDELGNGVPDKSHVQQFTRMLSNLGLQRPTIPNWIDWSPYAGYNLHFHLGLNTKHYFKGIGSLAMSELFDPNRNRSVVLGLERLYADAQVRCEYFYNHIETDEDHGSGWLRNVIIPIVKVQPEAGMELAIGGALRMQSMRRYNTYLANRFGL
jgi:pyrroloquinoline quinone (PQQ) biosynthesis protein C